MRGALSLVGQWNVGTYRKLCWKAGVCVWFVRVCSSRMHSVSGVVMDGWSASRLMGWKESTWYAQWFRCMKLDGGWR